MPLDVSHLPASLHPYLWGGTAAMVAEASTFPIGELTPKVSSPIPHLSKSCLLSCLSTRPNHEKMKARSPRYFFLSYRNKHY